MKFPFYDFMTKIEFINIITVMHRKMTERKGDYIRYLAFLFQNMREVDSWYRTTDAQSVKLLKSKINGLYPIIISNDLTIIYEVFYWFIFVSIKWAKLKKRYEIIQ